ncbi:MAG TPA: hypothetical protein VGK80_11505 [Rhodanobacteraceae bacterium]
MERYGNFSGDSGVIAFELHRDGIEVRFVDGPEYLYTIESAGPRHIAEMKRRARDGRGLSTWISQEKPHYAKRLR